MSTASVPAVSNAKAPAIVEKNIEIVGDIITNPAMFDHVQRLAAILANGAFTPKHLIGDNQATTVATCFRVAAQAIRWGFDPFAVADETYSVGNRLGYQGKLIIAVINSRAGLKAPLRFDYAGKGATLAVTVRGTFKNEDEERTITLTVEQAKTSNGMWAKDPEQKLAYSGATKWARRHCPQVIMGVHTIEDLEAIQDREAAKADRKPAPRSLADLMQQDVIEHKPAANIDADQPTLADRFAACKTHKEALNLRDDICGPESTATEDEIAAAQELYDSWCKAHPNG